MKPRLLCFLSDINLNIISNLLVLQEIFVLYITCISKPNLDILTRFKIKHKPIDINSLENFPYTALLSLIGPERYACGMYLQKHKTTLLIFDPTLDYLVRLKLIDDFNPLFYFKVTKCRNKITYQSNIIELLPVRIRPIKPKEKIIDITCLIPDFIDIDKFNLASSIFKNLGGKYSIVSGYTTYEDLERQIAESKLVLSFEDHDVIYQMITGGCLNSIFGTVSTQSNIFFLDKNFIKFKINKQCITRIIEVIDKYDYYKTLAYNSHEMIETEHTPQARAAFVKHLLKI